MTQEEKLVYLQGQILCAQIEMEAMKAENARCVCDMSYPKYGEDDFTDLYTRYPIHHNGILHELYP